MKANLIDNQTLRNYLLRKMIIFSCKKDESLQTYLKYFKIIKDYGVDWSEHLYKEQMNTKQQSEENNDSEITLTNSLSPGRLLSKLNPLSLASFLQK